MERFESAYLQAVRRDLLRSLRRVENLLKTAAAPKRLSQKEIEARVARICKEIKAHASGVSAENLRKIAEGHGLPFHTVGALFAGGYLKKTGDAISLTEKGRSMAGRRAPRK